MARLDAGSQPRASQLWDKSLLTCWKYCSVCVVTTNKLSAVKNDAGPSGFVA